MEREACLQGILNLSKTSSFGFSSKGALPQELSFSTLSLHLPNISYNEY